MSPKPKVQTKEPNIDKREAEYTSYYTENTIQTLQGQVIITN